MHYSCTSRKIKVLTIDAINVPMALLQVAKKYDSRMGFVALCVAMKCISPSSTYIFRSVRKFRDDFHLGNARAKSLLKRIHSKQKLIRVEKLADGTEIFVANSFRKLFAGTMMLKGGVRSQEMSVVKVSYRSRGEICINEIEKELKELLYLADINAKSIADELQSKGLPLTGSSSHAARMVLSVKYMAKGINRSVRTVVRRNKAAREQGIIEVTSHPLIRCCDNILHDPLNAPTDSLITIGTLGFTRRCNDYQLLSWDWRHRFQHIIYKHRSRMTFNIYYSKDHPLSQTELHDYLD